MGDIRQQSTATVGSCKEVAWHEWFCNAEAFYAGVNTVETFERDFRPICEDIDVIPVMLIMIIDLYFRLTPATMVPETPEVIELARVMRISPDVVNDVLQLYQHFDPYLSRPANLRLLSSPLMPACRTIWQRFGNSSIEGLASYARELKEFFYKRFGSSFSEFCQL